jgi:ParB family chromosome partitioning protein
MTTPQTTTDRRVRVRLGDLGLAPENLRFDEPADEGVPRLADTIRAAGLLYPPIVRKGRKGEEPFMVLDGRRRRFALLVRVDRGEITLDDEVECLLAADKASQAAAAVLTASEHAPVHLADVIVAIGKLRKARMATSAIAGALGYDELEIKRLEALASVHPTVLAAFRQDRLTIGQVRMFARVKDRTRQAELAQTALHGYFHDYQLKGLVQGGRVTLDDPRFALVGRAAYAEAGGRFEADLFGELPDVALDTDLLSSLWRTRAETVSAAIGEKDLTVYLGEDRGYRAPDGLYGLPYVHIGDLPPEARAAFDAARERIEAAMVRLQTSDEGSPADGDLSDLLLAQLEATRAKVTEGTVEAVLISPATGIGLETTYFWKPPEVSADPEEDKEGDDDDDDFEGEDGDRSTRVVEAPEIAVPAVPLEVGGIAHGLHEVRTDLATRGLIRALADHPEAALIALTAQLFKQLALHDPVGRGESALTVSAVRYGWPSHPAVDSLDGEVRRRLEVRRDAYRESAQRPIGYVASLAPEERLGLLAELVALSLDLREPRTTSVRRPARAEAAEIAGLCGADLTAHWTPDAPFLSAHPKAQLLGMLSDMSVHDPRAGSLKKDELVGLVAIQAAERRWAPASVQWSPGEPEGPQAVDEASEDVEAQATDDTPEQDPADVEPGAPSDPADPDDDAAEDADTPDAGARIDTPEAETQVQAA